MGFHPMSDRTDRREQMLDMATQLASEAKNSLAGLSTHCILLELFEAVDAQQRAADAWESIAKSLAKIANPAATTQAELPLRAEPISGVPGAIIIPEDAPGAVIVPRGRT